MTETDSPYLSPQQQLWKETTQKQQMRLAPLLRILKKRYQDDLCYGLVAYIRFKIQRPFPNPMMQMLYDEALIIICTCA